MRLVEIARHPDDAERAELIGFVETVTASIGRRPLSDHLWLDLRAGGSPGFVAVRAADPSGTIGLAQISTTNDSAALEVVASPTIGDADRIAEDLAVTATDAFVAGGGGALRWWVDDPTEHDRTVATRLGLAPERTLHEMRRSLPIDELAEVATRAFAPGSDDAAWLVVNNRAFAGHGEQGGWTAAMLAQRLAEPWFDADGFRIHEREGRIAAFCWTKLHAELDPIVGEIYVIAVDPRFRGLGLGRQLTLAGLESIAERGVHVASLYVDADNAAAMALYEALGFAVHRTRVAFAGTLVP